MSFRSELGNGSTVEKLADGTKIQTSANGTVLKLLPDGTKIQTSKEGIELKVFPDGRKEQTNAKGVKVFTNLDGSTKQVNVDGTVIETSSDKKTRLQINIDGSKILSRADGTKLQTLANGTQYEIDASGKKSKVGSTSANDSSVVSGSGEPAKPSTPSFIATTPTAASPASTISPDSAAAKRAVPTKALFSTPTNSSSVSASPVVPKPSELNSRLAASGSTVLPPLGDPQKDAPPALPESRPVLSPLSATTTPTKSSPPPPPATRPPISSAERIAAAMKNSTSSAAIPSPSYGANEIRALQAKYDALLKTNGDLKTQLATINGTSHVNEAASLAAAAALAAEKIKSATLEAELEVLKENSEHLERTLASKSDDSEAVSKAAAEHAKRLVKFEKDKENAERALRDTERELKIAKEQIAKEVKSKSEILAGHASVVDEHGSTLAQVQAALEASKLQEAQTAGDLATTLSEKAALETKLTQVLAVATNVEAERAALNLKLASSQAKLQLAENRLEDSIVKGGGAANMLAELKFAKATAEERCNSLQERVSALESELEANKHLHLQVKSDHEQTINEIGALSQRALLASTLEQDLEVAKAMKESLETQLNSLQTAHDSLKVEHEGAKSELGTLKDSNRLIEVEKQLLVMITRATEAETLAIKAGERIDELERDYKSLTLEKEELRLKLELASSHPVAVIASSSEHAPSTVAPSSASEDELRSLRNQISQLNVELVDAHGKVRTSEVNSDNVKSELTLKITQLEREIHTLEQRVNKPGNSSQAVSGKGGLLGFRSTATSSRKLAADAETEASEHAEKLQAKERELEDQRNKTEQSQRLLESQVISLVEKSSALETALLEKSKEIDVLLASRPQIGPGEVDVGKLHQQVKKLEGELQAKTTRVDVAVAARQVAEEKAVSAEAKITMLTQELEALKSGHSQTTSAHTSRIDELEKQLQEAKMHQAATALATSASAATSESAAVLMEEKRRLQEELEKAQTDLTAAQKDLRTSSSKLDELQGKFQSLEKEKNEYMHLYKDTLEKKTGGTGSGFFGSGKKGQGTSTETQLLETKQQLGDRERELTSSKAEIGRLQAEKKHDIDVIQAKLDAANKDKENALNEMKTQMSLSKEEEVRQWKVKYEAMEKEKNSLIASLTNELNQLKAAKPSLSKGGSFVQPVAPPPSRPAEVAAASIASTAAPVAVKESPGDFLSQLKMKKEQFKSSEAPAAVSTSATAPGPELSGVAALRAKFNNKKT